MVMYWATYGSRDVSAENLDLISYSLNVTQAETGNTIC